MVPITLSEDEPPPPPFPAQAVAIQCGYQQDADPRDAARKYSGLSSSSCCTGKVGHCCAGQEATIVMIELVEAASRLHEN